MKLSRLSRYVAVFIAAFSMLFMQLAVAGYACPNLELPDAKTAASMAMAADSEDMSDCGGVDMEQPNLCHAHAQANTQSLDKPQVPSIQSFIAGALTLVFENIELVHHPRPIPKNSLQLTRVTAPSLSIRHCCFRI